MSDALKKSARERQSMCQGEVSEGRKEADTQPGDRDSLSIQSSIDKLINLQCSFMLIYWAPTVYKAFF